VVLPLNVSSSQSSTDTSAPRLLQTDLRDVFADQAEMAKLLAAAAEAERAAEVARRQIDEHNDWYAYYHRRCRRYGAVPKCFSCWGFQRCC